MKKSQKEIDKQMKSILKELPAQNQVCKPDNLLENSYIFFKLNDVEYVNNICPYCFHETPIDLRAMKYLTFNVVSTCIKCKEKFYYAKP